MDILRALGYGISDVHGYGLTVCYSNTTGNLLIQFLAACPAYFSNKANS